MALETYFLLAVCVQLAHSIEELKMGFHSNNFLFPMKFPTFLAFELCFSALFLSVLFFEDMPFRAFLMHLFLLIMFANGIWHIVWARVVRKYVPGLLTAPLHILVFLGFYFSL